MLPMAADFAGAKGIGAGAMETPRGAGRVNV